MMHGQLSDGNGKHGGEHQEAAEAAHTPTIKPERSHAANELPPIPNVCLHSVGSLRETSRAAVDKIKMTVLCAEADITLPNIFDSATFLCSFSVDLSC